MQVQYSVSPSSSCIFEADIWYSACGVAFTLVPYLLGGCYHPLDGRVGRRPRGQDIDRKWSHEHLGPLEGSSSRMRRR